MWTEEREGRDGDREGSPRVNCVFLGGVRQGGAGCGFLGRLEVLSSLD